MRFADYVVRRFPDPLDVLDTYFADAQAAASSLGALLDEVPVLDGQRRYLAGVDGKRDKRHFYRASIETDGDGTVWPTITFGTFKQGGATTYWKPRDLAWQDFRASNDDTPPTEDRRAEYARRAAELRERAEAERAARDAKAIAGHAAASRAAVEAWAGAMSCISHAYLTRKAVPSYGLRVATLDVRARLWNDDADEWQHAIACKAGDLLVPMHDAAGNLVNVQRIDANGRKRFLMGGRKAGAFYRIPGDGPAWIAEGYATAATVHAATGVPVVVAFDAGNIAPAAQAAGDITAVAADNDANHAGRHGAERASLPYVMPPQVGRDWNDHAAEHGLPDVAERLRQPLAAPVPVQADAPAFVDLATLPAIELEGREQGWFNRLAKASDPTDAAAIVWAICRKRGVTIPTQQTLPELMDRIRESANDLIAPATLTAMSRALSGWNARRQARALSHVRISREVLKRHRHEVHDALPTLTADEYAGVILLWAPMASGKTQRIGKPFSDFARTQGRFVATCHRRSLVSEMAHRLGCQHYADITGDIAWAVDAIAVCLPSITKAALGQIFRECDYLFIDEIAQVLRFMESDKTCRTEDGTNADVYRVLRDLVRNARCVIGADAGMDDRVVRFLEECRPHERFRIIEVRPRDEGLSASYGYGADAVTAIYGEMCARVADGQRIWVSCESEKRVGEVAKLLTTTGARVLAVTANNRGNAEQARFWTSPEDVSREYDAVVHSPVISSGLSIQHDVAGPWFDHGFFIGGGHAITPADAAQMMRRVRYLKSWSLAFVANTLRGQDDPGSMILGMEAAAVAEGDASQASEFDAFVAGIKADTNAARADFAAGMAWVLEASCFSLSRLPESIEAADEASIKQLRMELDAERRAAVIAAPDLTEDEARRLRNAERRTQADSDALLKHAVRTALGVSAVDEAALDVWDDGRGPRRLDRFSAAVWGVAIKQEAAKHMTQRRFSKARVTAYRDLFDGFTLAPGLRVGDEDAELLVRRVIDKRHMLAWLGVAPTKYGACTGFDKAGKPKPFPVPKYLQREVGDVFRAMGLNLARRQNRHAGTQYFELVEAAFQETAAWAERRNSHTSGVSVLGRTPPSVTVELAEDDQFWLDLRRAIWSDVDHLTRDDVAARVIPYLRSRPVTHGAKTTAWWLRNVVAERLAA